MLKLKLQYFGHLWKNWFTWKGPDAGKDWRQEKGMTEDEMLGWHHWLDGHEFEQVPRVADGQGGLVCIVHGVAKSQTRLITELNWIMWLEIPMLSYLLGPDNTQCLYKSTLCLSVMRDREKEKQRNRDTDKQRKRVNWGVLREGLLSLTH